MKKTILTISAALLALGFSSCSIENGGVNPEKDGGVPTAMKLSLSFPSNQTKATGDPNATDAESAIQTVDVFIYTSNGTFSSHAHLSASDFTQDTPSASADRYTSTTKIPTTTGAKDVYVGINLPVDVVNSVKGKSEGALFSEIQTFSRAQLATANNFIMFSKEVVSSTFVENASLPSNNLTVKCQRLVAKVTVAASDPLDVTAVPGTIGNLKFAVNNFNTKLFLMQGAAPDYKDPNWANAAFQATDFDAAIASDYANILDHAVIANPTVNQYEPRYAAENTSELKRKKEITRVTISATFVPSKVMVFTNGSSSSNGFSVLNNPSTTPATFYVVTPSAMEGSYYFTSAAVADEYAASRGGVAKVEYTNGICYWHIYLNKDAANTVNRWDVLRNDYYKCIINKISGIGRPTPEITDPETETTPDVDTNITVSVEVLFWNTIVSNYNI